MIAPTPAFVTLIGGTDETSQVQIVTTDHLHTGTYTVSVQTFEEYSQITKVQSFNLIVKCVSSIVTTSTIPDKVYYITEPNIAIPVPSYALTPSACPIELNYEVKQVGGAALPAAITVDQTTFGSEVINIFESDVNAAAIYQIQIKAIDQKTLVESDLINFKVEVRLKATGLVIQPPTVIPSQNYLVSDPALSLAVPEYDNLPSNADVNCYHQLGASTPAFVTLVGDPYGSPTISVTTTDGTKTGVYLIDIIYTDEYSLLTETSQF